jgi:hypothetical protein
MIPTNEGRVSRRRCWFHAASVTKYAKIRSRVGWFAGHWANGRSARCAGSAESCSVCASGKPCEFFFYVFLEVESGEVLVWNIPRRLEDLAREMDGSENGGVGLLLAIRREGILRNSRIEAEIVGFEDVEELDIEPFVATLGVSDRKPSPAPNLPKVPSASSPREAP